MPITADQSKALMVCSTGASLLAPNQTNYLELDYPRLSLVVRLIRSTQLLSQRLRIIGAANEQLETILA